MTKPIGGGTWEICKLAADELYKGLGAGNVYRKYGFQEAELENYEYIRGDIAFEYNICANEKHQDPS